MRRLAAACESGGGSVDYEKSEGKPSHSKAQASLRVKDRYIRGWTRVGVILAPFSIVPETHEMHGTGPTTLL